MNAFQAYEILMRRMIDGNRLLFERFGVLLAGNSILAAAWFMAVLHGKFPLLWIALPSVGILSSLILGVALWAGARAAIGWLTAMDKIEQDPDFDYMKQRAVRPLRDITGPAQLRLWKLGWYGFPFFSLIIIALWGISLIEVL